MADTLSREKRSRLMGRIRGKNTAPELRVRSALHRLGYRFRLHTASLPGRPDVVLPRHRLVVFVHGCFWHGHPRCRRSTRPTTNQSFWEAKLDANKARDARTRRDLRRLGWRVIVVWECWTRDDERLRGRLRTLLAGIGETTK